MTSTLPCIVLRSNVSSEGGWCLRVNKLNLQTVELKCGTQTFHYPLEHAKEVLEVLCKNTISRDNNATLVIETNLLLPNKTVESKHIGRELEPYLKLLSLVMRVTTAATVQADYVKI